MIPCDSADLVCVENSRENKTELLEIVDKGKSFKSLLTVDRVGIRTITSHCDRIICDDMVFKVREDGTIDFTQNLPESDKP